MGKYTGLSVEHKTRDNIKLWAAIETKEMYQLLSDLSDFGVEAAMTVPKIGDFVLFSGRVANQDNPSVIERFNFKLARVIGLNDSPLDRYTIEIISAKGPRVISATGQIDCSRECLLVLR